jgi:hypothetical protein
VKIFFLPVTPEILYAEFLHERREEDFCKCHFTSPATALEKSLLFIE